MEIYIGKFEWVHLPILMVLGVMSGVFSLLIYWAIGVLRKILWWVDDYEGEEPINPIRHLLARMAGYTLGPYRKNHYKTVREEVRYKDAADILGEWALGWFLLPTVGYLFCRAPVILIVAGVLVIIAFMARSGRRLQKVLQKHIDDPNAHVKN